MTRHTKEFLLKNSLFILRPDIAKEWDANDNKATPKDYSLGSNYKANWICNNGHKYSREICHRTRKNGIGCPYCAGRIKQSIEKEMPQMLDIWDLKENNNIGLDPKKISPGSNKEACFKCSCGYKYRNKINYIRQKIKKSYEPCPKCNRSIVSETYNLEACFPLIAKEWDKNKNKVSPKEVLPSINDIKFWWICEKGHSFDMTINARTNKSNPQNCPICSGRRVTGDNNLEKIAPDIAAEWNSVRNGNLKPTDITSKSNQSVWWTCPKGHEYRATAWSRVGRGTGCGICSNQTSKPELRIFSELEFIFGKNYVHHRYKCPEELDIFISKYLIAIEYDGAFRHNSDVKEISDKRKNTFCKENNIKLIRVREFPLKKISQEDLILGPSNILDKEFLNLIVHKLCDLSGIETPQEYLDLQDFCNEQRFIDLLSYLPGPLPGKSLAVNYPDLALQWDHELNNPLSPEDFTIGSHHKAHWICDKGHKYLMTIKDRTSKKKPQNCPYCSGRRVSPERSLAVLYPKLIPEWDFAKNEGKTPEDFTFASSFRAWWICPKGHSYSAKISSRTRKPKGSGCKTCFDSRVKNS